MSGCPDRLAEIFPMTDSSRNPQSTNRRLEVQPLLHVRDDFRQARHAIDRRVEPGDDRRRQAHRSGQAIVGVGVDSFQPTESRLHQRGNVREDLQPLRPGHGERLHATGGDRPHRALNRRDTEVHRADAQLAHDVRVRLVGDVGHLHPGELQQVFRLQVARVADA
jgi:hypothetical protein